MSAAAHLRLAAGAGRCHALRMRCAVSLTRDAQGIVARCREYPACEGRGATAGEAVERLRASLLFWLEACPCDTTTGPGLELDVVHDATRG